MRTRIRCHSAGSRALRSSEIGETGRACNIQSTVKPIYKDVVVIGNGPSAITLSYFLSGHWPYYCGNDELRHPIEFLDERLRSRPNIPMILQDLKQLSEGLEGRSSNPVSLLFDALNHPGADLGLDMPTFLTWKYHPEHAIDHVVLGSGLPGGSWQAMDGNVLTISLGSWMELPDLRYRAWQESLAEWAVGARDKNRASVAQVARYYQDYVHVQGLRPYFRDSVRVTSVRRLDKSGDGLAHDGDGVWLVTGHSVSGDGPGAQQQDFSYVTPNVVLATGGFDLPNKLNVAGESLPFVVKSLHSLEQLISSGRLTRDSRPVLIVGAGLSAADAIIAAQFRNIDVIHAFRRQADDPGLIFRKLPANMYPEYHKVYQMMKDHGRTYTGYTSLQQHQVIQIQSDGKVCLQDLQSQTCTRIQVSYVVVLIGSRPNLGFLEHSGRPLAVDEFKPVTCTNNPIDVDVYTLQSNKEQGLYAMGPLVADNFVRFAQGGAVAIAQHLHSKWCPKRDQCPSNMSCDL